MADTLARLARSATSPIAPISAIRQAPARRFAGSSSSRCGTSYHAGLAGRIALERWARIPVEVDLASEFRYRAPLLEDDSLIIGITQSGETADTLAAMRLARARGAHGSRPYQRHRAARPRATPTACSYAGGHRDRRRRHQDVRRPGGSAVRVRAEAGRAAWHARAARLAELRDEFALLPERIDAVLRSVAGRPSRWSRSGSPTAVSSSISDVCQVCRSRWRER